MGNPEATRGAAAAAATTTPPRKCPPQSAARSHKAPTRWTSRLIPVFLLAVVTCASWLLTGPICIDFFLARNEDARAIVFLVLHYLFLILMVICYGRTLHTIVWNPGVVPLEPKLTLESFYTRDVYTCRSDGLPIWCSECQNWKPDRAHHSGEIQRCVYKMDHYCPWAGGMIGETSFKFFIQFCSYTSMYCAVCLSAGAYVTNRLIREGAPSSAPAIVLIALAAFFGLFSFTMASLSLRFAIINTTNIENLRAGDKVYQLAIRISLSQTPNSDSSASTSENYETITFPLPHPDFEGNRFAYDNNQRGPSPSAEARPTPRPAPEHKFAIVKTEVGENPWDTGSYYQNFQTVMGDKGLLDWLLPLRLSPCCAGKGQYPVGPVVDRLRERLKS